MKILNIVENTMKRQNKIYRQEDFGAMLGIPQCRVSRLLNGAEEVSFPLAVKLDQLFPGRGIMGWKTAAAKDVQRLYDHLKMEAEARAKESERRNDVERDSLQVRANRN